MSLEREIAELEARRQLLAARSDLYRLHLVVEARRIEASTAWMRRAWDVGASLLPLLKGLLPFGAGLVGRRKGGLRGTFGNLMLGWQLARSARTMWKSFARDD